MSTMTDESIHFMPKRLGNTISKIVKALEQSNLSNQYLPIIPEWHTRCGYIEQIAAKFWIQLVKYQRDTQLTSAYDLPEKVIANKFIDYLGDKAETYWKARKENYLAHVDKTEYVTSDPHQDYIGNWSQAPDSSEILHRSENVVVTFRNTPSDSRDTDVEVPKCDISIIPVPLSFSEIKLDVEDDINKYQHDNEDVKEQNEKKISRRRWSPRQILTSFISFIRGH